MKKTTIFNYDNVDIRELLRDEMKRTGLDNVAGLLDKILEQLDIHEKKLDKINTLYELVDQIAGDIKNYREEQELNSNKLSEHNDQLEKHEEILQKFAHPVA